MNKEQLNNLGIVSITLAEFKQHAADAQNESIDFQLECCSSHIQSQCKVGFLSVEKFQQFLDKNPDFHNENDSDFYNWESIDPKLQGLDIYPCYISDLNLFGYYSK